jgi:hypothetical protein
VDDEHGVVPGWEHQRITLEPDIPTLEDFVAALEDGDLERFVQTLPRLDTSTTDADAVAMFREAVTRYLFR